LDHVILPFWLIIGESLIKHILSINNVVAQFWEGKQPPAGLKPAGGFVF
jgi:hypothetical protein